MDNEPATVKLRRVTATLRSGSEVSVGFPTERKDDDSYYFHFKNTEGEMTGLRLSREAFEAIICLKERVDAMRYSTTEIWTCVIEAALAADTSTNPTDAPRPAPGGDGKE